MPKSEKPKPPFDPQAFLAKVGTGRSTLHFRAGQAAYTQGDPADAVFYIREGKLKLTVVSSQGKEAVIASWRRGLSSARAACAGRRSEWPRPAP